MMTMTPGMHVLATTLIKMNPLKKTLQYLRTHNIVLYKLVYKTNSRTTFATNYIKLFIFIEIFFFTYILYIPLPSSVKALKDTSDNLKSSSNMSESTSTPAESLRVKEVKAGKLNFDSTEIEMITTLRVLTT